MILKVSEEDIEGNVFSTEFVTTDGKRFERNLLMSAIIHQLNILEESTMVYNAKEYVEGTGIPAGTQGEAEVIEINDSTLGELFKDAPFDFKGDPLQTAIEVVAKLNYGGQEFSVRKVFNYREVDGKVAVSSLSGLGKYKKLYGKLPEVGDKVKVFANAQGFWRFFMG